MELIALIIAFAAVVFARKAGDRVATLEAELASVARDAAGDRVRILALERRATWAGPAPEAAPEPPAEPVPTEPTLAEPAVAAATDQPSPWAFAELPAEDPARADERPATFDAPPLRLSAAPVEDETPGAGWNFEELFGRRLPVWGGGIALALAGFFLVKYSIEVGLVTPAVRTMLGLLFGIGLIGGAEAAHRLPRLAADPRVAQALSGAGVATLYGVAYMATNLYGLISPATGFAAMAAVTALALVLALRHGAPTALLGLIGGFATPALVNTGEGSAPALLGYLLLTVGGLLGVARVQGWRWLGFLALAGGFGWSGLLLATHLIGFDLTATGLFLILLAAGGLVVLGPDRADDDPLTAVLSPFAAAMVAFVQLAILIGKGGFGWTEWGLYALLSLGVTALALRDAIYRPLTAAALAVALVTFALWPVTVLTDAALVAGGMVLLFALPGYALSQREGGLVWSGQAVAATALTLALFDHKFRPELASPTWALLCVALAMPAALAALVSHRRAHADGDPRRALFATTAAALAGTAAAYTLAPLYLPLAILMLTAGVAALARRWSDRWLSLSAAAGVAAAGVALLLFMPGFVQGPGRLVGLVSDTDISLGIWAFLLPAALVAIVGWPDPSAARRNAYAALGAGLAAIGAVQFVVPDLRPITIALVAALLLEAGRRQDRLPATGPALGVAAVAVLWAVRPVAEVMASSLETLAGNPLFVTELPSLRTAALYLLAPAVVLLGALWRPLRDGAPGWLAAVPAALGLVALFVGFKQLFGIESSPGFVVAGFPERTLLTQLLFGLGALAYAQAGRWSHALAAGRALTGLAVLRFVWFDILVFNPLLQAQVVGDWPIVNLLPIAYGLPVAWLVRWRATEPAMSPAAAKAVQLVSLASLALLAGLLVRQAFQGALLPGGAVSSAENYAYSLVGLIVAVGLLLWGAARSDQTTRLASLAVMLATVGKVFLADAAALEGLWRIASFFGLGLSLIGVSWFYTRHVFTRPAVAAG